MFLNIDWAIVSVSFAAALIFYHLYLVVLARIRRRKAEQQVKVCEARLKNISDLIKQKINSRKEG